MVTLNRVVETDLDLQDAIANGGYTPTDPIYIEIELADADLKTPKEIGDGRKKLKDEFYIVKGKKKAYLLVGRKNKTPKGKPNGNFQKLNAEEFKLWVDTYPLESFKIKPPSEEVIE